MFDKLFELIGQFWDTVKIFQIVFVYERGVRMYKGAFVEILQPGLHWKWPIIEEFLVEVVERDTILLHEQTLTSLDGHTVVIRGVLTSAINDIKKYTLKSTDQDNLRSDVCYAPISECVRHNTWDFIRSDAFIKDITDHARKRSRKYGLRVIELATMDHVKLRAYRIIGER